MQSKLILMDLPLAREVLCLSNYQQCFEHIKAALETYLLGVSLKQYEMSENGIITIQVNRMEIARFYVDPNSCS